ncbi:MAG TPA: class I SAM-dependent rRNA methyltransferase [Chitinophagales bacterium]|nr:class I SAM-dependent rRNA methyltransferase [Chitinophagales bacterium]
MKTEIILKRSKNLRIASGHPWIYGNEIDRVKSDGESEGGTIVDVKDDRGKFVGRGYFNPKSQIVVRLLSRIQGEEINESFFRRKILSCYEYRKKIGYSENFRLVFGEGDFLPALIIDKFRDVFVMQTLSLGMDRWKEVIASILKKEFSPRGIYERNDVPVRKLEGLEEQKGFLTEPFPTKFEIEEHGVKFKIDVENGQKTGYFLDQKENRLMLSTISAGAEVLDCFCYTGSFAMFAAKFGAKKVTALDASEEAIQLTKENASLNGLESVFDFKVGNAFDVLPQWVKEKKSFDIVILDPPAFTKSRSGVESATRGYKEINLRAMKLIRNGGFLLTFSCSHFMDPSMFFDVVSQAATDAAKTIRQVAFLSQAKDHPVVWNIPETNYLKGFLLQVI